MTTPFDRNMATSPSSALLSSTNPFNGPGAIEGNHVTRVIDVVAPGRDLHPAHGGPDWHIAQQFKIEHVDIKVNSPILVGHGKR
ncbi:MAG: hypothetical protein ABSE75_06320 [Acidimicrobiales bacterium]